MTKELLSTLPCFPKPSLRVAQKKRQEVIESAKEAGYDDAPNDSDGGSAAKIEKAPDARGLWPTLRSREGAVSCLLF
ncbi:hypothetical protein [Candidatus Methylacidiphilum fumarolicum]|uniref:Uncharacterized protein n=1 Tax=Candidatus Methylacidiphilum fumarolicum TaxID=591154 RepID=A0ABN8XB49_9BACT|nr:hypothetical protein [Candidatus Methylacidiphilum fumarolicum]CAI9084508.1 protein of unknown function [Candidatus Methylacidiphilum fumarolicum]